MIDCLFNLMCEDKHSTLMAWKVKPGVSDSTGKLTPIVWNTRLCGQSPKPWPVIVHSLHPPPALGLPTPASL
ncbi:hypothetical protein E2C01_029839 [Portunus trituberculatus]|uniref:Uncharacterized protein n=1 Tax=Portunus trituberculatus TaxID=210409 RepID=A0A5B7EU05_PORTR|nr:hypothetical protein [Portunus trituberculatus]